MRFWSLIPGVLCALLLISASPARAACDRSGLLPGAEVAEVQTALGSICIELFRDDAPLHVDNFLFYLENGLLTGTFFHRSLPGFILQGASFRLGADDFEAVPALNGPVTNEPCTLDIPLDPGDPGGIQICSFRGNERGTLALAKLGGDPHSGTTGWFVNLSDNRGNLDNQNGGFTVFGRAIGDSMDVVDAIVALHVATENELLWIETALFDQLIPLRELPLSDSFGCFDPTQQATVLITAQLPALTAAPDPVLSPLPFPPFFFPFTVALGCGTPIAKDDFVPNPGSSSCVGNPPPDDRLAVGTNGPRTIQISPSPPVYESLTCLQVEEVMAQRALWLADYKAHLIDNLVLITATSVQQGSASVPMLPAVAAGLFAALLLVAGRRHFARG